MQEEDTKNGVRTKFELGECVKYEEEARKQTEDFLEKITFFSNIPKKVDGLE